MATEHPRIDQDHWNLKVFCAVAEEQSTTRAAKRLMMGQPGVSMAIGRLEQHYGVPLFTRRGNRMALTEAGVAAYEYALTMLRASSALHAKVHAIKQRQAGLVSVATRSSLSSRYLPPILVAFWKDHREVELRVTDIPSRVIVAKELLESGFDFAVLPRTGGVVVGQGIVAEHFHSEPVVMVVAPHHPLASRTEQSLADVARYPLIAKSRDSAHVSHLQQQLRATAYLDMQIPIELDGEGAKHLVAAGAGVGLILQCRVASEIERGELCVIQPADLDIHMDLILVYKEGHDLSAPAQALMSLLREAGTPFSHYDRQGALLSRSNDVTPRPRL